jgi:hypothetical protein
LLAVPAVQADHPQLKTSDKGDPQLQSVEALTFGPQGLLLIGDGKGKQLVAIDTGDVKGTPWSGGEIKNIREELAGRLGTTGDGIEIRKLAVNPASQTAYIAVRKLSGKQDLILTVDGAGKIRPLDLQAVTYARIKLPTDAKVTNITDLTWAGDRVLVAAQASDTFGSKIFSVAAPLANADPFQTFSTETYHVAHNRWETKAPIRTVIPYEEDGQKYVVGAFTCTPIVKYPVSNLEKDAKVKGTSVIELGNGNTPQDMIVYVKDGKKYILMNTYRMFHKRQPIGPSPYWTAKVDYNLLREDEKINEKALRRVNGNLESLTDRAVVVPEYHGVTHLDQLDARRALVIRTNDKGGFDLQALPLP